ncbi:MAG: hypothetical protein WCB85_05960 [Candidatus Dormiibacterota bacterium]
MRLMVMAEYQEFVEQSKAALVDGVKQAEEITLSSIDVLRAVTALFVPLSVVALPNGDRLVPTLDTVVTRGYEAVSKVVEAEYGFAVAALERVGAAS